MIVPHTTATTTRAYLCFERLARRGCAFLAVGLVGAEADCRAVMRAVLSPGPTSSYDGRMSGPELYDDFAAD